MFYSVDCMAVTDRGRSDVGMHGQCVQASRGASQGEPGGVGPLRSLPGAQPRLRSSGAHHPPALPPSAPLP